MRHEWEDPRNPNVQAMIAEGRRLFATIMGVTSEVDTPVAHICAAEIERLASALAEERERVEFLEGQNRDLANACERLKKGKKRLAFLKSLADAAAVYEGTREPEDFEAFQRLVHEWNNRCEEHHPESSHRREG